jgi:hypothetical protein
MWNRHRVLLGSATAAATAALIAVGVPALALSTQPASTAGSLAGSGYPPPGGIYTGFTNCPVKNALMHESNTLSVCVLGDATSGSITLGTITTPVTAPVNVQFGFYQNTQQTYYADVVPPPEGLSAQLATKPDLIPMSLTTALGCATATDPTVMKICQTAQARGGAYNQVSALAESDGAITNFNLFSWTQPVMFRLINPLLGNDCTIGTFGHPVMLNPQLSVGPGGGLTETPDPNPAKHPDTDVIGITNASASDSTFSAPGVTNCGPGGVADIPVGAAIDASSGLPAASGNSLTLTGTFQLADTFAAQSTPGADNAAILLSALKYSRKNGHAQKITMAQMKQLLDK